MNWPDDSFHAMEGRVDCVATAELEKGSLQIPMRGVWWEGYGLRIPVLGAITKYNEGIPTWDFAGGRTNFC